MDNFQPHHCHIGANCYASFNGGMFDKQTYDGKIYAVPTNLAAACVFYNTEIFDKVGVEVPVTYDELLDVCQKIQDAGISSISCSAGTAWCLSMIAGYLCDREGGPDNLDAVNAGDSNDVATAGFYNGEAAMLVQGSWAIAQINGSNPEFEDKCGVFQFPAVELCNGYSFKSNRNTWIL